MLRGGRWIPGCALMVSLWCARDAQAGEFKPEIRLGARAVAEMWQEPALARIYRSSRFAGAGTAGFWFDVGLPVAFGVEADMTWHRMTGSAVSLSTDHSGSHATTLELLPAAFRACVRYPVGEAEIFGGLGPAVTSYQETAPMADISGNKVGLAMEAGIRFDTHFVDPPMEYPPRTVKRIDAEVFAGRRQHQLFDIGTGLDLSAWRVGAGLAARF